MQSKNSVIELVGVQKDFGSTQILSGVNLSVKEGEFVSIRGKSGVGKSTLLKIIGCLEKPDRGTVELFGQGLAKLDDGQMSELRLRNIGLVFQFFNLLPSLTVQENIELPLALASVKKVERKQRISELVDYFGLSHLIDRFPDNLSGGEKQRIAVIRALVNKPKLIIADEPTSSIDDENTQLLMDLLVKINKDQNVTIVMSTTDMCEKLPVSADYTLKDAKLTNTQGVS